MGTNLETSRALRIFWVCGLVGVLVDFDHVISLLLWKMLGLQITNGRLWHAPLFVLSSIAICYLVSHFRGFYSKLVLVGVIVITGVVLAFSPFVTWGLTE